jgi:hypothetical protein
MKAPILAAVAVAISLPFAATLAEAGPIERACMQSGRGGSDRGTCTCIQQVADMTLRGTDQKRAAKFFSNPDEAQRVRISNRSSDEAFWGRYKAFGQSAEAFCAG